MRCPLRHGGKGDLTACREPAVGLEPTTSALRKRPLAIRVHWQRAVGRHRTGTLRLTEAALSHLSFDGTTSAPCRLCFDQPACPIGKPQTRDAKCHRRESNPQRPVPKTGALSVELLWRGVASCELTAFRGYHHPLWISPPACPPVGGSRDRGSPTSSIRFARETPDGTDSAYISAFHLLSELARQASNLQVPGPEPGGSAISPTRQWSGRPDLNRRPPGPRPGALPNCATSRYCEDGPTNCRCILVPEARLELAPSWS